MGCNVSKKYYYLKDVPDKKKTQQICDKFVDICAIAFLDVPEKFITPNMCINVLNSSYLKQVFTYCNANAKDRFDKFVNHIPSHLNSNHYPLIKQKIMSLYAELEQREQQKQQEEINRDNKRINNYVPVQRIVDPVQRIVDGIVRNFRTIGEMQFNIITDNLILMIMNDVIDNKKYMTNRSFYRTLLCPEKYNITFEDPNVHFEILKIVVATRPNIVKYTPRNLTSSSDISVKLSVSQILNLIEIACNLDQEIIKYFAADFTKMRLFFSSQNESIKIQSSTYSITTLQNTVLSSSNIVVPIQTINLNESNESNDSKSGNCSICLVEKNSHVFLPCGHICSCDTCSKNFISKACPICRKIVQNIVKIYIV